jgi:hypothetical protein
MLVVGDTITLVKKVTASDLGLVILKRRTDGLLRLVPDRCWPEHSCVKLLEKTRTKRCGAFFEPEAASSLVWTLSRFCLGFAACARAGERGIQFEFGVHPSGGLSSLQQLRRSVGNYDNPVATCLGPSVSLKIEGICRRSRKSLSPETCARTLVRICLRNRSGAFFKDMKYLSQGRTTLIYMSCLWLRWWLIFFDPVKSLSSSYARYGVSANGYRENGREVDILINGEPVDALRWVNPPR